MLAKTAALVLGSVKYGDSSVILKTFTENFGRKTFIASGGRSKKAVLKPALIQPLSQLQLVFYENSKGEIQRIKEVSVEHPYQEIPFHPIKSSLAIFLAELLGQLLQEDSPDPKLFQFLSKSFLDLDGMHTGLAHFHIKMMFRLTHFLGFAPEQFSEGKNYFDLMNGVYLKSEPHHPHFLEKKETAIWQKLQDFSMGKNAEILFIKNERNFLLETLLQFYRLHVRDFQKLKSLEVIRAVLT